jgi:3-isopropylmalate/(R)-2-methylmalate dehydratase small subunit
MILEGKIWRYGDNIDTDVIIPARYLNTADPDALAKNCMEDIDQNFAREVAVGDMIVAGRNFGCGSSREHAPVAIKASGITCVIAENFARIFYRNAINIGLPLMELGEAVNGIQAGDRVRVDLVTGTVENLTNGEVYQAQPLPGFIREIAAKGGLIPYVKELQS